MSNIEVIPARVCKGIQRLVENSSLENEYNKGTGWYGKGEGGTGQFVPQPEAYARSNYDVRGGACIPNFKNVECHQSKGKANCNEAQTCTQLLQIKENLLAGGYNCFGRHERTYWSQYFGEAGCTESGNCVNTNLPPGKGQPSGSFSTPSRYLSSWGYKGSKVGADAFKAVGLNDNAGVFASSPFPRCVDGLKLFAENGGQKVDIEERLMYVAASLENIQRKGKCTRAKSSGDMNVRDIQMLTFDGLRQMAGTPPTQGKNNWYMTHGSNMKGAFGEQIDEGYWMCLKPDLSNMFPKESTQHEVCANETVEVDFTKTFQFETDFLLSSESFHLMEACSNMETSMNDSLPPKLELTQAEVGSVKAFNKLLEIQNNALKMVPNTPGAVDTTVFHLGIFVHNNGGYRFPDTVHVPLRRIVEDTITQHTKSRFAIAQAIIQAGDGGKYENCSSEQYDNINAAIAKCYNEEFNKGKVWYWGGEDKVRVNVDHNYVSSTVYGSLEWRGSPEWYSTKYGSGYINAGTCLVASGHVTLWNLLQDMGCHVAADKAKADFKKTSIGGALDSKAILGITIFMSILSFCLVAFD